MNFSARLPRSDVISGFHIILEEKSRDVTRSKIEPIRVHEQMRVHTRALILVIDAVSSVISIGKEFIVVRAIDTTF